MDIISNLEKNGIEVRDGMKWDYNKDNQYSENHKDAISDGDEKGKGTNHSYTHTLPDHSGDANRIVHQLDTENGGNKYDIEGYNEVGGREFLEGINTYNKGENNYQKNDSLWRKAAKGPFSGEEYRIPDLIQGRAMKPQINVLEGGDEKDNETRERALGINKYSKNGSYGRSAFIETDIDGQVGW